MHLGMLILYTTQRCSTTGEVITSALYCKHWDFCPGQAQRLYTSGVGFSAWYTLMKFSVINKRCEQQQQQPLKKCLLTYLDHIINVGSMHMYVEIRFHQEPPWHYKPQQNGNHDVILNKKTKWVWQTGRN